MGRKSEKPDPKYNMSATPSAQIVRECGLYAADPRNKRGYKNSSSRSLFPHQLLQSCVNRTNTEVSLEINRRYCVSALDPALCTPPCGDLSYSHMMNWYKTRC